MYVYVQSEPRLFTVGFYQPDGTWVPESDHGSRQEAAARVAYLNSGGQQLSELAARIAELELTMLQQASLANQVGGISKEMFSRVQALRS